MNNIVQQSYPLPVSLCPSMAKLLEDSTDDDVLLTKLIAPKIFSSQKRSCRNLIFFLAQASNDSAWCVQHVNLLTSIYKLFAELRSNNEIPKKNCLHAYYLLNQIFIDSKLTDSVKIELTPKCCMFLPKVVLSTHSPCF